LVIVIVLVFVFAFTIAFVMVARLIEILYAIRENGTLRGVL